MTDTAFPVPAITGHDYLAVSPPHGSPRDLARPNNHATPPVPSAGAVEDDGQINCMCGLNEDDGWTVACDLCNTWQHQSCYYPDYEDRSLPEDLQHFCISCKPRDVDLAGARRRQMLRQDQQAGLANGARRQPPKSHKKKPKDAPAASTSTFTNGWPLDKSRHDRNSASPRDQAPPAKRPKTGHHPSDSTTTATLKGHSRKRTTSNAVHRRSLSHSPDTPLDLYSPEFMRCYLDDPWTITQTNLHNSMRVTNALTEWLRVDDDGFQDMHGYEKPEVLLRWDQDLDEIPGKAQIEIQPVHDNRVKDDEGNHPTWKMITVKEPVANGAYIGELKGHVGFKEDYQQDPSNRWSLLRHPEPFVFFHPRLPIYVDARNEGTELRYVRRSCAPNARLQILVTSGTDYHFCFMATQQIDPGMEVAVGWDTADGMPELLQRSHNGHALSHKYRDHLTSWVSTVLANSGPCACRQPANECLMCRFDRRGMRPEDDGADDSHAVRLPSSKLKRKKPAPPHISPLNTHVNSRSGSEDRRRAPIDPDDEPTDSRSTSGSGSGSRDITPNTHYSHSGSLSTLPEVSERERRKLLKEEEMFRKQEEEQLTGRLPGGRKGKRTSGGERSNLSTPSATTSKSAHAFGNAARYADAGTSRSSALHPASSSSSGKSVKRAKDAGSASDLHARRIITKIVPRPKPDYVDSAVQCDFDADERAARKIEPAGLPSRPFVSNTQRLLQRCARNNDRRRGLKRESEGAKNALAGKGETMDTDLSAPASMPSPISAPGHPPVEISISKQEPHVDVDGSHPKVEDLDIEMQDALTDPSPMDVDAPESRSGEPLDPLLNSIPLAASAPTSYEEDTTVREASHLPTSPPAPPWSSQAAHSHPHADSSVSAAVEKASSALPSAPAEQRQAPHMHLAMPPPAANPFSLTTNASSSNTSTIPPPLSTLTTTIFSNPTTLAHSPATLTPSLSTSTSTGTPGLFSPSALPLTPGAPTTPGASALVKKLSLSDYTRRNKAKDSSVGGETGKLERENSPGEVAAAISGGGAVDGEGEKDVNMVDGDGEKDEGVTA